MAEILIFVYNTKKQKQEQIKAKIEEMKKIQRANDEKYYGKKEQKENDGKKEENS